MKTGNLIRLNKFIANSGIAARRKADELIKEGRVTLNKSAIYEPGTKINPDKDIVKVDGKLIGNKPKFIYILLNKPRGYITSTSDEKSRKTVLDLIGLKERIYPVGRLDYDSEGLLLLTNDGEFANRLMHPKYGVEKTYLVKLNKPISDEALQKLRKGVKIEEKWTKSAQVRVIPKSSFKQIEITIHEGRNRQVRKMLESVGLFVRRLKRMGYGGLNLKGLPVGGWRFLDQKELTILNNKISI
jgi:pseudouridine synthase